MIFEKVFLIGNGRVADDCLRYMAEKGISFQFIEVFAEKFTFTQKLCERMNIPFLHIGKDEIKEFLLQQKGKILILSVHNSYIFPAAVCEKDNLTIINLHIAYLPEYRGMNPSTWAIYHQEKYAGVTWHTVSSKIDNGRIIVQRKVEIGDDETAMQLMLRCFKVGVELFKENLDSFLDHSFHSFIPENPNTKLYMAKDLPNDGFLNTEWTFDKAYAFLRSMDYSGANLMRLPRVNMCGKIFEITKYQKIAEQENNQMDTEKNTLKIHGGGYCLSCTLREAADQT